MGLDEIQHIVDVDKVSPLLTGPPYFERIFFSGSPGCYCRNRIRKILVFTIT